MSVVVASTTTGFFPSLFSAKRGEYAVTVTKKYKGESEVFKMSEKYLTIKVLGDITLRAWNNKEQRKDNTKAPHFKGEGVAVWISEKKPKEEEQDYCDRLV